MPEDPGTLVRFGYTCGAIAVLDVVRAYLPTDLLMELDEWMEEVGRWTDGPSPQPPRSGTG